MDSTYLPLLHLPMGVQRMLATSEQLQRRDVLACSTTTAPAVLELLIDDKIRTIQHRALRLYNVADTLTERFLQGSDCCKVAVARNTHTPPAILSLAAQSEHPHIRLAAHVNPATPEESRGHLDVHEAHRLTDVGSYLGAKVVRSHELIHRNRHLLGDLGSFTPMLRRAALGLWDITRDQYDLLVKAGRSKFAVSHPLTRHELGAPALSFEELIGLSNPAADLYLADHPDLQPSHANAMLTREGYDPEPHVLGRILRRFGYEIIPDQTVRKFISGTREGSGTWSDPLVAHYNRLMLARFSGTMSSLEEVTTELGDDLVAWSNYLRLEAGWEGSPLELAKASTML